MLSYLTLFFLFGEAFKSVLLWRGRSTITLPVPSYSRPKFFKWINVHLPLHSMATFVCLISLVENYDLLPSFFFAAVSWYVLKECISLCRMLFNFVTDVVRVDFLSGYCYPHRRCARPIVTLGCAAKVFHISFCR